MVYVAGGSGGAWSVRQWACQYCEDLAFLGDQAVTDNVQGTGDAAAISVGPALLAFPAAGSGPASILRVTGLASGPGASPQFRLIGSLPDGDAVVTLGNVTGTSPYGTRLLYHVSTAGQATEYGAGTLQQAVTPGLIDAPVSGFAVSPNGAFFLMDTGVGAGNQGACATWTTYVMNAPSGELITMAMPPGGGPYGWQVQSLWFDRTGLPYVSLLPSVASCAQAAQGPVVGSGPPIVCKLSDQSWAQVSAGVYQAGYGPGTWQATMTGDSPANQGSNGTLTISDGPGTTAVTVTSAHTFAWAP
jgi:hypothetical protein